MPAGRSATREAAAAGCRPAPSLPGPPGPSTPVPGFAFGRTEPGVGQGQARPHGLVRRFPPASRPGEAGHLLPAGRSRWSVPASPPLNGLRICPACVQPWAVVSRRGCSCPSLCPPGSWPVLPTLQTALWPLTCPARSLSTCPPFRHSSPSWLPLRVCSLPEDVSS